MDLKSLRAEKRYELASKKKGDKFSKASKWRAPRGKACQGPQETPYPANKTHHMLPAQKNRTVFCKETQKKEKP